VVFYYQRVHTCHSVTFLRLDETFLCFVFRIYVENYSHQTNNSNYSIPALGELATQLHACHYVLRCSSLPASTTMPHFSNFLLSNYLAMARSLNSHLIPSPLWRPRPSTILFYPISSSCSTSPRACGSCWGLIPKPTSFQFAACSTHSLVSQFIAALFPT
jgi:hypothetical protein